MRKIRAAIAILAFACASAAAPESVPDEMNGVHLKDYYPSFLKRWHMVTVRFRKDTEEMRITYANPKAWKALQAGGKTYPDGAVFAKIGIATQADVLFPSSAVPSGARRYQFMVRDQRKFASTDGWGYALFDANGKLFPERPDTQATACAACHRLARVRGYVFSQAWTLEPFHDEPLVAASAALRFRDLQATDLPAAVRGLLEKNVTQVRAVEGELQDSLFQGTLDEIRPTLAAEVARTGLPAALISRDGKKFSLVKKNPSGVACRGSAGIEVVGIRSALSESAEPYVISFCAR